MATPRIASHKGYYYETKAGQRYLWCSCGRSAKQPFCDGSHKGTEFLPVVYTAERDEDVIFCGCKHSSNQPFCDGTHSNLPGGYRNDNPDSVENKKIAEVAAVGPKAVLDNSCYVFSVARAPLTAYGTLAYCTVISPQTGALFLSQFYAEASAGASPVMVSHDRDTVLFVLAGDGEIEISGRRFALQPLTGVSIRSGETYRIHNPGSNTIRFFIWNGPGCDALEFADAMSVDFESAYPNRIAEIDPAQRHAMAERFYQILINREHGSDMMTQFIGNVPQSKAEPHRHLYEEVLIVLDGDGMVWTEKLKTAIGPGDVLFLPRKQIHSLQCLSPGGLNLVGVIYPGDNPSINY